MTETVPTFGPYRILEPIARGPQSLLFRAEHLETRAPVALKQVATTSPHHMSAFLREIAFLKALHHPGIVRILDDGTLDGKPWFAMELLEGPTIPAYHPASPGHSLARQPTSPVMLDAMLRPVLTLFLRLAETLLYLEQSGIVHRDIKPTNILMRDPHQPVLIDFGLAARTARTSGREVLEVGGFVVGSHAFMSPEQLRGELCDNRSDLFSLGATSYLLLTGRHPFSTSHQVLDPHVLPTRPSLCQPALPPPLDALLLKLLAKNPVERPQSSREVIDTLQQILRQESTDAVAMPPPRSLVHPKIAGRHRELHLLLQRVESMLEGRENGLLIVEGESGMGKTRLVREAVEQIRSRHFDLKLLTGECLAPAASEEPTVSARPLVAFRDAFQAIFEHCLAGGLTESERVIGRRGALLQLYHPQFRALPGQAGLEVAPYFMPGEARYHLFTSLRATLTALAPVLIVLDDLQWADPLSLELLEFLAQTPPSDRHGVIILGTYRTEHAPPPMSPQSSLLSTWRLPLAPLTTGAMEDMVRDMLGNAGIASQVSALIEPVAGGNPFFGGEFVRALVAEKRLQPTPGGRWRLAEEATAESLQRTPPQVVQNLILKRLSRLPKQSRMLLEAASLLETRFSPSLLAEIQGQPLAELDVALQHTVDHHLITRDSTGDHRFFHALIRQTVQQGLSFEQRTQLHRQSAQALERLHPAPSSDQKAALAHHWEHAQEPARAMPLYLQVARESIERHALQAAEQASLSYLRLATAPSAERSMVWRELGERVYVARGALSLALDAFSRAEQDAVAIENQQLQAFAQAARAELLTWQCRFEEAQTVMETVTRQLHEQGDRLIEAQMHLRFGAVLTQCWRQHEATTAYLAAVDLFRALGDLRGELMAQSGVAHGAALLPEAHATAVLQRCVTLSRSLNDAGAEAEVSWRYAASFSLKDDWSHLSLLEQAFYGLLAAGERRWTIITLAWLVRGRILCGPEEALVDLKEKLLTLLETTEAPLHRATLLGALGQLQWHEGALEKASQYLVEGISLLEALHDRLMRAHLVHDLAQVRADQGQEAESRHLFEQSTAHHLPQWPGLFMHVQGLVNTARLERRAAKLDVAQAHLARALQLCIEHHCGPLRLLCLCEAGHLALAQGETGMQALRELEGLVAHTPSAVGGDVGRALTRFKRALRAREEGQPLWQGDSLSELPPAVLQAVPFATSAAPAQHQRGPGHSGSNRKEGEVVSRLYQSLL